MPQRTDRGMAKDTMTSPHQRHDQFNHGPLDPRRWSVDSVAGTTTVTFKADTTMNPLSKAEMEKMEEDHWLAKRLLIITGDLRLAEENLFAMEARNARRREDEAYMTACRTETQQDQELAHHAEYLEQKYEHEQRVLVLKRNFKEQEAAIKLFRDTEYHRHQRELELLHETKVSI